MLVLPTVLVLLLCLLARRLPRLVRSVVAASIVLALLLAVVPAARAEGPLPSVRLHLRLQPATGPPGHPPISTLTVEFVWTLDAVHSRARRPSGSEVLAESWEPEPDASDGPWLDPDAPFTYPYAESS